jgi:hypothetical protein
MEKQADRPGPVYQSGVSIPIVHQSGVSIARKFYEALLACCAL